MGAWWSREDDTSDSKPDPPEGITRITDSMYSFSNPAGPREMDIVFIHGLQIPDDQEAYWKTWVAGEKDQKGNEVIWPVAWLREEFPCSRILSLCYDSSTLKTATTGKTNKFTVDESLVKEMVDTARVGQMSDCPIVFVCHSLGGLVVKEMVIQAHRKCGENPQYANFLKNIRGFQFYATPHDGSKLADLASHLPNTEKIVEKLKVINNNVGRLNDEFERIVKEQYADIWQFGVIAEARKTESHGFSGKVVEKASAQHGYQKFSVVKADHFGVCKPSDRAEKSFKLLRSFILGIGLTNGSLTWVNPPESML